MVDMVTQASSQFCGIMEAIHVLSVKVTEIKKTTDEISANKDNVVAQIQNLITTKKQEEICHTAIYFS